MIKAILFDLDGTLADTLGAIKEALDLALADYGFPPVNPGHLLTFISANAREYAANSLPERFRSNHLLKGYITKRFDEKYAKTYLHTDRCYPGIPEALETLRKHFRLGLLSNKQEEFVQKMSAQLFREGLFELAHGVRPGYAPKPDPQTPMEFARFFEADPSECIYVGDSDFDILTARNAGMIGVQVCWGYKSEADLRAMGGTRIAHDADELLRIIFDIAGLQM